MSSYQCSDYRIATITVAYATKAGLPTEEAQLLADDMPQAEIKKAWTTMD